MARKLNGLNFSETRVVGSHLEPVRPTTASSIASYFDDPAYSMQLMSTSTNRRPSSARPVADSLPSEKISYPTLPERKASFERSSSFSEARNAILLQQERIAAANSGAPPPVAPRQKTPPSIPPKPPLLSSQPTLIQQIGMPKQPMQPLIPMPGTNGYPIPSAPSRSSSGLLRDNSTKSLSLAITDDRLNRAMTRQVSIPRSSSPSGSSNSPTLFFAPPLPSKEISMDLNIVRFHDLDCRGSILTFHPFVHPETILAQPV